MSVIQEKRSTHDFKVVRQVSNKLGRLYTILQCEHCGTFAKRFSDSPVLYTTGCLGSKIDSVCRKNKKLIFESATIRVIRCFATGKAFANLTPGSIHKTIPTPEGVTDELPGVWVTGVGKPVKLLPSEYAYVSRVWLNHG